MTKNRALKRAARERAHLTGETYTVARRNTMAAVPAPAPSPAREPAATLHRWTHLVLGVPAHPDAATMAARHPSASRNAPHQQNNAPRAHNRTHPVRRKRLLVGWQMLIERRLLRG